MTENNLSPYQPTATQVKITREQFEQIKTMLGVECLFIATDAKVHDCDMQKCTGHVVSFRSDGFSDQQLNGLSQSLFHNSTMVASSHHDLDY